MTSSANGGGKLFKTHYYSDNSRCCAIRRFLCSSCPHRIAKANDKNNRQETFIRHSTPLTKRTTALNATAKVTIIFKNGHIFPGNNKGQSQGRVKYQMQIY